MGIKITVKGADYSGWFDNDIDINVDEIVNSYKSRLSTSGGTLSESQEVALHKMITSSKSAFGKVKEMYLFLGNTASSQAVSLMGTGTLTFKGTGGQYTQLGFNSGGTAYAETNYVPSFGFCIGIFAASVTKPSIPSTMCGSLSNTITDLTRVGLLSSGYQSDNINSQGVVRDGVNANFTLSLNTGTKTPSYLVFNDNNSNQFLLADANPEGVTSVHSSMSITGKVKKMIIGGWKYGDENTLRDSLNTTYKVWFSSSSLTINQAKKLIESIQTFLSDIGR